MSRKPVAFRLDDPHVIVADENARAVRGTVRVVPQPEDFDLPVPVETPLPAKRRDLVRPHDGPGQRLVRAPDAGCASRPATLVTLAFNAAALQVGRSLWTDDAQTGGRRSAGSA